MFEGKHRVRNKNANTINEHTANPETNVFTVRLMRTFLRQNPEGAIENKGRMCQGISKPFDEKQCRKACSFNSNSIK